VLQLAHLTGDAGALEKAERTMARFGPRIGSAGRAVPFMLSNLSAWHAGPMQTQIVLAGPRDREDTRALRGVLTRAYQPFATVIAVEPGTADQAALARLLPWVGAMGLVDGRAAAYVCRNFACERPITDPAALADTIRTGAPRPVGNPRD
jgi:uncharacterized protein YyaL (SSP411 family)